MDEKEAKLMSDLRQLADLNEAAVLRRFRSLKPAQQERMLTQIRYLAAGSVEQQIAEQLSAFVYPCPYCGDQDPEQRRYLHPVGYQVYRIRVSHNGTSVVIGGEKELDATQGGILASQRVIIESYNDAAYNEDEGDLLPAMWCKSCDRVFVDKKSRFDYLS